MDTLIELIVRGLIALFTGRTEQTPPPTKPAPRTPPRLPQNPTARRALQQRPQPSAMQRQQAILQEMMRRGITPKKAQKPAAPPPRPPARPMPAPPKPVIVQPTALRPQPNRPSISAAAIAQLISSRPSSLRTMYVLTEVLQPPLALRPEHSDYRG